MMASLSFIGAPRVVELPSTSGAQGPRGTSTITATDRMGKPRSVLITQTAKRSLAPVHRRSNLRKELLIPEMLDSKRFHEAVARHIKAGAEMRATARKTRTAASKFSLRGESPEITSCPKTPPLDHAALPAYTPAAEEPHGQKVTWAHERPFPPDSSMAQSLDNRPRTATPWGYMITKKIRQGKVRPNKMIEPTNPDEEEEDGTHPLVGVQKTPSEPLPRHRAFVCPPRLRAITVPLGRKKKSKTRTAADYLRMHHLALKEVVKNQRALRTDRMIVDELEFPWKMEAMCLDEDEEDEAAGLDGGSGRPQTLANDEHAVVAARDNVGEPYQSVRKESAADDEQPARTAEVDASATSSVAEENPGPVPLAVAPEDQPPFASQTGVSPLDLDLGSLEAVPIEFAEDTPASDSESLNTPFDESASPECSSDIPFGTPALWEESMLLGLAPEILPPYPEVPVSIMHSSVLPMDWTPVRPGVLYARSLVLVW